MSYRNTPLFPYGELLLFVRVQSYLVLLDVGTLFLSDGLL
jgi:hypothetical protein